MNLRVIEREISAALDSFAQEIRRLAQNGGWHGREREAVSLFAFGHLLQRRRLMRDPAQICLDGAVRQVRKKRGKRLVCCDLVVWPKRGMTGCERDADPNIPWVIMEWKVVPPSSPSATLEDAKWLKRFTRRHDGALCVGYAVSLHLRERGGPCLHWVCLADGTRRAE